MSFWESGKHGDRTFNDHLRSRIWFRDTFYVADFLIFSPQTLFGARPPFEKGRRASFAFIGCRGECQLPWLQQVQRPAGKGPSTIQLIVGELGFDVNGLAYSHSLIQTINSSKRL